MADTINDETLRKILADEVLILSPDDAPMARAIRDGSVEATNNFVRIALSAMRFAYEFGRREEQRASRGLPFATPE